jgi:hypothetical protein
MLFRKGLNRLPFSDAEYVVWWPDRFDPDMDYPQLSFSA